MNWELDKIKFLCDFVLCVSSRLNWESMFCNSAKKFVIQRWKCALEDWNKRVSPWLRDMQAMAEWHAWHNVKHISQTPENIPQSRPPPPHPSTHASVLREKILYLSDEGGRELFNLAISISSRRFNVNLLPASWVLFTTCAAAWGYLPRKIIAVIYSFSARDIE